MNDLAITLQEPSPFAVTLFPPLTLEVAVVPPPSLGLVVAPHQPVAVVLQAPAPLAVSTVGVQGPPGPQGEPGVPGAGSPCFVFPQSNPAAVWPIAHGLGKYPSVTVVDSAGSTVWGDAQYIDSNNLTLHFAAPFSGTAYLN